MTSRQPHRSSSRNMGSPSSGQRQRAPQSRKPSGKRRKTKKSKSYFWNITIGLFLFASVAAGLTLTYFYSTIPQLQNLAIPQRPPDIRILDNNGEVIANRGETGGANLAIDSLPEYVPQAFIAIEDRRFYHHFGIDPIGISRALIRNISSGEVQEGGSTLTQQLAKNLFLTQERTMERKIHEAMIALWLEWQFSKQKILELYINRVYFGAGAYGIDGAARRYFNKPATQLTLAEAAMMAGLVKAPSRLAPTNNFSGAQARAEIVLRAMYETGYITQPMLQAALNNPAEVTESSGTGSLEYIADWVMQQLDSEFGRIEQDIIVETTIDINHQKSAERALLNALATQGREQNVEQGALVALDANGAVRAMVGGKSYRLSQFNRAVNAKRQPGSAFKPFVYLAALEAGYEPLSIVQDAPLNLNGWRPQNYSDEYFGNVEMTRALSLSLNTVAVRLALAVGPQQVANTARRMGILSPLDTNASIALGTSEVSLMEIVGAYAPLANGGIAVEPYIIERVRDNNNEIIYRRDVPLLGRIIAPSVLGKMNYMMRETLLTGTGKRAQLPNWQAGGKTGTTQNFRDAWFIGYTGRMVTGVWLGNDDSTPTNRTTGGGLPVTVWSEFMQDVHQDTLIVALPGIRDAEQSITASINNNRRRDPSPFDDNGIRPQPNGNANIGDMISRWIFGR